MKILQISFRDAVGGAENIGLNLHREFLRRGHDARLVVGYQFQSLPGVFEIDPFTKTNRWIRPLFHGLDKKLKRQAWYRESFNGRKALRLLATPKRAVNFIRGIEDFEYAGPDDLFDSGWQPDIIQLHNLHKDYFDLRQLPDVRVPLFWTLHDTWLMAGHCGYFVDCHRWKEGCGQCPDLRRYPHVLRDQTAANLLVKKDVMNRAAPRFITPSAWLKGVVQSSFLARHSVKVIHNGVDTSVFHAEGRQQSRRRLGFTESDFVCMFVAQTVAPNHPYKDFSTVKAAVQEARSTGRAVKFFSVGQSRADIAGVISLGLVEDSRQLADCYRAADVLLHAAHVDNYPNVVLEAMASGTMVIATNVGGIGEQIRDGVDGYLVPRGDFRMMAQKVVYLIDRPEERRRFGEEAAIVSRQRSITQQVDAYENLYREAAHYS